MEWIGWREVERMSLEVEKKGYEKEREEDWIGEFKRRDLRLGDELLILSGWLYGGRDFRVKYGPENMEDR